jgi:hypothetical protein
MRFSKHFAIVLSGLPTLCFLTGHAAWAAYSDSKSDSQVLNGAVQDKEKMGASVKLLLTPAPVAKPLPVVQPTPFRSSAEQFFGSAKYWPRSASSAINMMVPQSNARHNLLIDHHLRFDPPFPRQLSRRIPVEIVTAKPGQWNYPATPRNGIMIWSPEYATKYLWQPASSSRKISLSFSSSGARFLNEQRAHASVMNYATPSPAPLELHAVQQMLPVKHAPAPANWNLWYERVARTVYAQWAQNTSLGPGKALLQLTVYASRNVQVKVVDFNRAAGADQNAPAENRFREASLKAITVLEGADVWTFPACAGNLKRVAFDMELNHAVGEAPGCSVAQVHSH